MLTDGVKVPSIDELIVTLNKVPCRLHERVKASLKILSRKIYDGLELIVPDVMRV